jgi:hypothetical protein
MGRWLAPLLPGPQRWVLHDRDADLLAMAAADVAGATLVTASALLDLLTWDELTRLIHACVGAGCSMLFASSVSGRAAAPGGSARRLHTLELPSALRDDDDRSRFLGLSEVRVSGRTR